MAELTHYYLRAGIACPSIWELYDVRRVDETAGKTTPDPPKRWGMFKYKTENWVARAHYATLSHYFRALRPGARLWETRTAGGLLPTAVSSEGGWDIVLTNRFRYAKRVRGSPAFGELGDGRPLGGHKQRNADAKRTGSFVARGRPDGSSALRGRFASFASRGKVRPGCQPV